MPMRKISNPNEFRTNIRRQLNKNIENETKSKSIERGVYNFALKECTTRKVVKKWDNPYFTQIYLDRLRSIMSNLNNTELLQQLKSGTIQSSSITFMSHQEMMPNKWDEHIKKKMIRDKYKYDTTIEAATDTFKCRKCHKNKCTYYQMQTRSADEPMTTFVSCIECGNRWKC